MANSAPRAELRGRDDGFSLIELMIVILIIGILMAIALPSLLGARTRAQDRAAQSNLRTALAGALVFYSDNDTFSGFDVTEAESIDPPITWAAAGAPAIGNIAIEVAGGSELVLTTRSQSFTYWCVAQIPGSPVTSRGGDAVYANVDTSAECVQGWT